MSRHQAALRLVTVIKMIDGAIVTAEHNQNPMPTNASW